MKITALILLTSLFACETTQKESNITDENQSVNCSNRSVINFNEFVSREDSTFLKFTLPIDSINELINSDSIKCYTHQYSPNKTSHKSIWHNNGKIIKIENYFFSKEGSVIKRYYVQDNCHWFYEREKYHYLNTDSLVQCDLFYYHDTTILKAFVGAALYQCKYMFSVDSNRFSIQKGNKARESFYDELEWFSK